MPMIIRPLHRLTGAARAACLLLASGALLVTGPARAEEAAPVSAAAPSPEPDGMGHLHPDAAATAAGAMAGHDDDEDGDACPMDAHHGHHGHLFGHGMHGGHPQMHDDAVLAAVAAPAPPGWLADLALTEAQEDRIFEVLHEVAPAQRKAQRLATHTQALLHHGGMATDYNEANTRKIADQHGQAVAELARLAARTERRILDILTPEQRRDAAHRAAHEE